MLFMVVLFPLNVPLLSKNAMVLMAQGENGSEQNVMLFFVTNLKRKKKMLELRTTEATSII